MDDREHKVLINTFTDPMMGLSWEYEPTFRKLETHFPGMVEFRYMMAVLVPDVYRLVEPQDLLLGKEIALRNYNARLADVYKSEEAISGMPINMDGFHLFSLDCPSSRPLCLAYKAALLTDRERAGAFLYNLRYATVVECRQTTKLEEIMDVARETGIDTEEFLKRWNDGTAENALEHDLRLGMELGIRTLPAYLIQYRDRQTLVKILIGYDEFVSVIEQITEGQVRPHSVKPSPGILRDLLKAHPRISLLEVKEAFDLNSSWDTLSLVRTFVENEEIVVKDGFIRTVPHS